MAISVWCRYFIKNRFIPRMAPLMCSDCLGSSQLTHRLPMDLWQSWCKNTEKKSNQYSASPFWPVRAWKECMEHHSAAILSAELNSIASTSHRQFAVVTYWCPDRVGSLLHNLFNSIAMAIITNRAFRWQCDSINSRPGSNTWEDCDAGTHTCRLDASTLWMVENGRTCLKIYP